MAESQVPPRLPTASRGERLSRRRVAERAPITPSSVALFRLGEVCNHHCPMCSNSGRPEGHLIAQPELLRRVDWLHAQGLRRVVVTGGEPTIHPAFWQVAERLAWHEMAWDINTNGSRLADPGWAERAAALGLLRAIVSLHSHDPTRSAAISGIPLRGHAPILAAITELQRCGVQVMVNCVLTRPMLGDIAAFVRWCAAQWGSQIILKLVFPSTAGKGGGWAGIDLTYSEVRDDLRAALAVGEAIGLEVVVENVPPCITAADGAGSLDVRHVARSGFGETHYLEDLQGDKLFSIEHIEAWFNAYAPRCRGCRALRHCPGVAESYLRRHGSSELSPLS
jgi:pyruvate-formate lyase-activating enzyme